MQILPASTMITNLWKTVRRKCILILGFKQFLTGLNYKKCLYLGASFLESPDNISGAESILLIHFLQNE